MVVEAAGMGDKMKQTLDCPICEKRLYSELGKGCKMCGMPLENKEEIFCCKLCMRKYKTINKRKGKKILVGNRLLMKENGIIVDNKFITKIEKLEEEGNSVILLSEDKKFLGVVAVADTIKETSAKAIKSMQDSKIDVYMITGDNERTANAIARKVGIKESNVFAQVLPENKSEHVKNLQKKGNIVAMVGDGVNDAPALTQANIGIAIGAGTDVAIESADIVLVKNDLVDVPVALKLSRATMRNIKQNLFFSFGYNTLGIPIAAGILYPFFGLLLSPMIAAGAMSASSISVLLNALRLKRVRLG